MPSASKKQHNFMAAVAHSPAFAKKAGVPQSVGQEFTKADKGRKFAQGGHMAISKMGKPTMKPGMSTAKVGMKPATPMADTAMAGSRAPAMPAAVGMKKGGVTRADGIVSKGHTKGKQITMCGGGMAKGKK